MAVHQIHVIGCQFLLEFFQIFLAFRHVHLIRHDNLRTFHQAKIIGFKPFIDSNIIFIGVASFTGSYINNMQDNTGTLNVTKELGSLVQHQLAPSINPGRSATAKDSPDGVRTMPKFGTIVVK